MISCHLGFPLPRCLVRHQSQLQVMANRLANLSKPERFVCVRVCARASTGPRMCHITERTLLRGPSSLNKWQSEECELAGFALGRVMTDSFSAPGQNKHGFAPPQDDPRLRSALDPKQPPDTATAL